METHTLRKRTEQLKSRGIDPNDYDQLALVIAKTCRQLGIRPLQAIPMLQTLITVIESDRVYQETGVEVQ